MRAGAQFLLRHLVSPLRPQDRKVSSQESAALLQTEKWLGMHAPVSVLVE